MRGPRGVNIDTGMLVGLLLVVVVVLLIVLGWQALGADDADERRVAA